MADHKTSLRGFATLVVAATLIITLGGWAPAFKVSSPESTTPAGTSTYFTPSQQRAASQIVAAFAAKTSQPVMPVDPSSQSIQIFNNSMVRYVATVPWESVYAQWDCRLLAKPTTSFVKDLSGKNLGPVLIMESAYMCGDNSVSSPASAGIGAVAPAVAAPTQAGVLAVAPAAIDSWTCGTANGASACIRRNTPSTQNPVEFRGQQTIQSSKAMRNAWGIRSDLF